MSVPYTLAFPIIPPTLLSLSLLILDKILAIEAIENKDSSYTGTDALVYIETDFQFIKPDLDINIKVAVPKNNNNLFDSIGNYARIEQQQEDGTSSIWYYFIIGSK